MMDISATPYCMCYNNILQYIRMSNTHICLPGQPQPLEHICPVCNIRSIIAIHVIKHGYGCIVRYICYTGHQAPLRIRGQCRAVLGRYHRPQVKRCGGLRYIRHELEPGLVYGLPVIHHIIQVLVYLLPRKAHLIRSGYPPRDHIIRQHSHSCE